MHGFPGSLLHLLIMMIQSILERSMLFLHISFHLILIWMSFALWSFVTCSWKQIHTLKCFSITTKYSPLTGVFSPRFGFFPAKPLYGVSTNCRKKVWKSKFPAFRREPQNAAKKATDILKYSCIPAFSSNAGIRNIKIFRPSGISAKRWYAIF